MGTLSGLDEGSLKPDFVMLEGWPATFPPPTRAAKDRNGTPVRVVLADLTFATDDGPGRWSEARSRKQKYRQLLDARVNAGWAVDITVRVIMASNTTACWTQVAGSVRSVVTYLQRLKRDVYGVELSTAALQQELCPPLMAQGRVKQSTLAKIPWPDRHFDLLFSSDVLEHIPTFDIPEVIREMVRVTKGDVFMSISLRRAHDDPKPPAEPTIHVTVQPREWWDKQFKNAGCTVNQAALDSVLAGRHLNLEPWLFSYRCGDLASTPMMVKALTKDPLWTHNVPKGRLLKPRIIHRRFDGSPYFPNEAVITRGASAYR